jgi:hypothetical protein
MWLRPAVPSVPCRACAFLESYYCCTTVALTPIRFHTLSEARTRTLLFLSPAATITLVSLPCRLLDSLDCHLEITESRRASIPVAPAHWPSALSHSLPRCTATDPVTLSASHTFPVHTLRIGKDTDPKTCLFRLCRLLFASTESSKPMSQQDAGRNASPPSGARLVTWVNRE